MLGRAAPPSSQPARSDLPQVELRGSAVHGFQVLPSRNSNDKPPYLATRQVQCQRGAAHSTGRSLAARRDSGQVLPACRVVGTEPCSHAERGIRSHSALQCRVHLGFNCTYGPTPAPIRVLMSAPKPCRLGSAATTAAGLAQPSAASHPSTACPNPLIPAASS